MVRRTKRAEGGHADAIAGPLRELSRHRPDRALEPLRAAVANCSTLRRGELARRLYWLATALLRLERSELAIKSLASAQKLRPRGHARSAYLHRVNDYGMPRRGSPELDDFWAFYSIQACRYLEKRPSRRFAAAAEKDLVTRVIAEGWLRIRRSGRLEGAPMEEKLRLFSHTALSFPLAVGLGGTTVLAQEAVAAASCPDPEPLVVDFRRGKRLQAEDRCPCGSGLPYCRCCGRTQSPLELQS